MNNLGNSAAYMGLLSGPSKTEAAQRELGTLERLNQYIEKDRKEDMMYQELEAKEYEEIKASAMNLLERDREKVNKKVLQMQGDIKEAVKSYGSRKKFIEAGGLSTLKKYKSDLMYSPEVGTMQDNKNNLERIMQIMVAGKGHLLTQRDLQSLQEYNLGVSNKITFAGMKAEVDIPHEFQHWGYEIPPEMILSHGSNHMTIYSNFIIDNPQYEGIPPNELKDELINYTKQNYGGLGKEKAFLMEDARRKEAEASRRAITGPSNPKEPEVEDSYFTSLATMASGVQSYLQPTGENILAGEEGYQSYWDKAREAGNPEIQRLFGGSHSNYTQHFKRTILTSGTFMEAMDDTGRGYGDIFKPQNFQLASAVQLPTAYRAKISKGLYEEKYNAEKGTVNVVLDGNNEYFRTNGVPIKAESLERGIRGTNYGGAQPEGEFKVKDYVLAWMDENGEVITNVLDGKGKVRPEEQKLRKQKWGNTNARLVMLTVLEYAGDDVTMKDYGTVFQKHEIDNAASLTALKEIIGSYGNIKGVTKQVEANQKEYDAAKQQILREEDEVKRQLGLATKGKVGFDSEAFVSEARAFKTNTGDRTQLIKAYYMTQAAGQGNFTANKLFKTSFIEQRAFTQQVSADEELQRHALNKNQVNDVDFIGKMLEVMNKNEKDEKTLKENGFFAEMWKTYYQILNK